MFGKSVEQARSLFLTWLVDNASEYSLLTSEMLPDKGNLQSRILLKKRKDTRILSLGCEDTLSKVPSTPKVARMANILAVFNIQ